MEWYHSTTEQDSFFTVTLNRWLEVVSQPGHANQDKICPDKFSFTIPVGWSVKKGKRGFASILEKPGCSREPRVFQENIGFSIESYEFFGFGFPRYMCVCIHDSMSMKCLTSRPKSSNQKYHIPTKSDAHNAMIRIRGEWWKLPTAEDIGWDLSRKAATLPEPS